MQFSILQQERSSIAEQTNDRESSDNETNSQIGHNGQQGDGGTQYKHNPGNISLHFARSRTQWTCVDCFPAGGMDIEAVAEETPEKLMTVPLDIAKPIPENVLLDVAKFLEFKGDAVKRCADEIQKLYTLFKAVDAVQIEINPLAETDKGEVISVDAKLNFDDNAQFRQKDIFNLDTTEEDSDPREVEAAKYNLNYVAMDGNIGCLVNGAGLAMATMDIIKLSGGEPANFLDVGGGVNEDQVAKAFEILTSDPKVKGILVNVFGGIVNCATIANGIVAASKKLKLNVPLVVRLEGTNVTKAREILKNSGLPIQTASDLDDAAQKAVASL